MENDQILKTGTTTVGIVCKEGVILAADRRATAGNLIVNKKTDKIYEISDKMALTMAGTVSDAQLLSKLIKAEVKLKEIRSGRKIAVKETANLLGGMVYSNIRRMSMIPGISHFLLGGKDETGHYLYDIFPDGSVTECEGYVTSGSGSVFAYGLLETLYHENMSLNEGMELAVKCINASMQRDSASGNGINMITITEKGIKRVLQKENDPRVTL